MADKKQFGVRLPPDTAKQVEQYAEEHDISKSDALRRAVDNYFLDELQEDESLSFREIVTEAPKHMVLAWSAFAVGFYVAIAKLSPTIPVYGSLYTDILGISAPTGSTAGYWALGISCFTLFVLASERASRIANEQVHKRSAPGATEASG